MRSCITSVKIITVTLVILLIGCFCQLYMILYDFSSDDKWTNSIKPVGVDGLDFPTVTLCNYNRVNKTKLPEVGLTEAIMWKYVDEVGLNSLAHDLLNVLDMSLLDHFLAVLFESFENMYTMTPQSLSQLYPGLESMKLGRALYNAYKRENLRFESQIDILKAIALDCKSAYTCIFAGLEFDCCQESEPKFTEYGACFTVQPPKFGIEMAPRQTSPGSRAGLRVYMCARVESHINMLLNNFVEIGYKVLVGYDTSMMSTTVISIPVGYHSSVEIQKVMETTPCERGIVMFGKPCTDRPGTELLKFNYSRESCMTECRMHYVLDQCHCLPNEISRGATPEYRICSPDDMYDCIIPRVKNVLQNLFGSSEGMRAYSMYKNCRTSCAPPCERSYVTMTTSLSAVPSPVLVSKYVRLLNKLNAANATSEKTLANGLIILDIYFNGMTYTKIESYPKTTFEQLLGSVGGVISLYVGVSMFSLVKLCEKMVNGLRGSKSLVEGSKNRRNSAESTISISAISSSGLTKTMVQ